MHWFFNELFRVLSMGGYARYVWPAYGFAFIVLFLSIYFPSREHKALLRKLME